jgi:hypothetical protein
MPEAHLVTFNGRADTAHCLVDCLEAAGVDVRVWTLPTEPRGGFVRPVIINMSTRAAMGRLRAGVHRFQSDFPGRGHVQVDWHEVDDLT